MCAWWGWSLAQQPPAAVTSEQHQPSRWAPWAGRERQRGEEKLLPEGWHKVPAAGCRHRVRVWPLSTWYSSAAPTSLLSCSSVPSSVVPFCPSWELLPDRVLLLRDESRESSSVRSMVTGVGAAERRLETCPGRDTA